ncbi:MAG: thiamine pyrophosphate-dependent enzyme [Candidatus Hodarchaeota archaeon]
MANNQIKYKQVDKLPGHPLDDMLRTERIPTGWCSGCGIGRTLTYYLEALKEANINLQKVVTVSGIGCTGRASGYVKTDGFHTTHGRAIPFAHGVKSTNPELIVNVFTGDGDLFSIGGNHFIHGARRNLDINIICLNNHIYALTGGQVAPTTFTGARTTTTRSGGTIRPFNLVALAKGSGATYVARYPANRGPLVMRSLKRAFEIPGFTFNEIISPCPTVFGRLNKLPIIEYWNQLKKVSKPITEEQRDHPSLAPINFGPQGYEQVPYGVFVDDYKEEESK